MKRPSSFCCSCAWFMYCCNLLARFGTWCGGVPVWPRGLDRCLSSRAAPGVTGTRSACAATPQAPFTPGAAGRDDRAARAWGSPGIACPRGWAGLTGQLSAALRKAGTSPLFDRGTVLVSLAAAIALGHQHERHRAAGAPSPRARGRAERADGAAGPGPGRDPGHAGPIARARARARAHAWQLIQDTPAWFPWMQIAGKPLTGWVVIDIDATMVTASSDKEGAAPHL